MTVRLSVAIAAVAVLAACSPPAPHEQQPAPSPPDPRARTQYTVVWSDAAGLNLLSPEGTYLRASVESLRLAAGNGDRAAAYPGFWESLSGAAKAYADGFYELGPDDPLRGVARFEIVSVTGRDQGFEAGVCIYERQLGTEQDGHFVFARQGSHHWKLSVQRAGRQAPPAPQVGPEPAPPTPVFGSWRTVGWSRPAAGETDPCQGRPTPGVAPESWPALMPGSRPFVTDSPPEAPSFPGWSSNVT